VHMTAVVLRGLGCDGELQSNKPCTAGGAIKWTCSAGLWSTHPEAFHLTCDANPLLSSVWANAMSGPRDGSGVDLPH
jgi:hypothetical protein